MNISKKIVIGYAVVLVLLIIGVATGYYTLRMVNDDYSRTINKETPEYKDFDNLQHVLMNELADYRAIFVYPDDKEKYIQNLKQYDVDYSTTVERLNNAFLSEEDQSELNGLKEIEASKINYEEKLDNVITIVEGGNLTEALSVGAKEVEPAHKDLLDKMDAFYTVHMQVDTQKYANLTVTANSLSLVMIAISVIALVLGLAIAIYITRSIRLQLNESVSKLSSASAQILATTAQSASSASETASAVSETTATAEEVKQTSELSSEKAQVVAESAQKAASVAQQARTSVAAAVEGINHIKEQEQLVAESVIKLSEQSRAIGDIITTVKDMAEQSNLLAVNAAIEAAKAGEQGKGFAVVAQEVKNLAEQSKQATAHVCSILDDIQKATSAAVMATEQVNKAVEAGTIQANEVGEAIGKLADSIEEAANAATQIAASSREQLVGINQIVSAMESIKVATQQNVSGTKQAEKAAQNLNELGQKLKAM